MQAELGELHLPFVCMYHFPVESSLAHLPLLLHRFELLELLSASAHPEGVQLWKATDLALKNTVCLRISHNPECLHHEFNTHKLLMAANVMGPLPGEGVSQVDVPPGFRPLHLFPLEFMDHDLQTFLYRAANGRLPVFQAREIVFRVCQAIHHLHDEEKVAHCDIQPAHIVLSSSVVDVRLTSLKAVQNRRDAIHHLKLHEVLALPSRRVMYLAPEYFRLWTQPSDQGAEATTYASADVWAIGVLFFEMLYGRHPFFEGLLELASADKVKYGHLLAAYGEHKGPPLVFPDSPADVPDGAKQLIRECLAPNPAQRPSAISLLTNQYIT
ncbi:hypothetical protein ACHHYP_00141 [Achlya hypogyna]|uniref:Protein kinase domain-containing protein n=1 Tax=Achlya hypogyna TaxID=1202772 RepID=A0A1V9ZB92_ACHHY|nr:hypothetical protein ACHHYP_00141 [Achlya hypogyna]